MERHIFICGSKSIGQYGGYETFVDKLTEYHQNDPDIHYYIACKANGSGCMDESKLQGVTRLSDSEFIYHNAHCVKLPLPDIGPAVAIYYDYQSMKYWIRYCQEHHIQKPIFYLLTSRIGPLFRPLKKKIQALGGQFFLNPDGHEWKRAKWSPPVQRYWKLSEKLLVKYADLVICDSVNIQSYIEQEYKKYSPRTTFIAYGAETDPSSLSDNDEMFTGWMKEKGLQPFQYYLAVGRFVPENNFETMIREFMASKSTRTFALITNTEEAFFRELDEKLHFSSDPRIRFVGTVYHQALLKKIRENAYGYFHGHEVGGTNPSLLEALGSTQLNLLLNVGFNQEVGQDAALYWSKEPGSLSSLIDRADAMGQEELADYGQRAKNRIRTAYSWSLIADAYARVWQST